MQPEQNHLGGSASVRAAGQCPDARHMQARGLSEQHGDAGRVLAASGLAHSDPHEEALEDEDRSRQEQVAAEDSALIDEHFKGGDQVLYLILGVKEGNSASEIKEFSGMTQHQYEAAKKRFHRGLDKIFPGRRKR